MTQQILTFFLLISLLIVSSKSKTQFEINPRIFEFYSQKNFKFCYGVAIDAGSSGSRILVYKWPCRSTQVFPNVDLSTDTPQFRNTTTLASFSSNLGGIPAYLNSLISFANQTIPQAQRSVVPIYLGATAGVRLLPTSSQDAILGEVINHLKTVGYQFRPEYAKVLTGQEEGVYGWLAVNFLWKNVNSELTPLKTRAVMDVGGASVQITYALNSLPSQNGYTLSIKGLSPINLYSYSHLYFGNDQARNLTAYQFNEVGGIVLFPCSNIGYDSEIRSGDSAKMQGTSNYTACRDAVRNIFKRGSEPTSSINSVFQAPVPTGIAYSGLGTFSNIAPNFGTFNISANQLAIHGQNVCGKTYAQLQKDYPENNFIHQLCFQLVYLSEITNYAFRLDGANEINMQSKIGSVTVSWTLGYLVDKIGEFPCNLENPNCVSGALSLSFMSSFILIISSLIMFIYYE